MSPTQCPRNFNDASFCAWLALLDDRTSRSFLIAVTQIMRLAGLPDDTLITAPAAETKKGRGKT